MPWEDSPAGTILGSEPVALGCPDRADAFERLGEVQISGLVEPMTLCRWRPLAPRSED